MHLILCTCPEDICEKLAKSLIEAELAACVNILPKVQSVYRWEDEIQQESETLLLILHLS